MRGSAAAICQGSKGNIHNLNINKISQITRHSCSETQEICLRSRDIRHQYQIQDDDFAACCLGNPVARQPVAISFLCFPHQQNW